jgi:hypothetical protein
MITKVDHAAADSVPPAKLVRMLHTGLGNGSSRDTIPSSFGDFVTLQSSGAENCQRRDRHGLLARTDEGA